MNNRIKRTHRNTLLFIFITLAILMLSVNFIIYFVSHNFMDSLIQEENEEFLLLTTYLIDENDLQVAIEYVGHYSESHDVEVEIYFDDERLYSSVIGEFDYTTHTITTNKGDVIIYIDNSHSVTVDLLRQKYQYSNVISVLLFIFTMVTLSIWNRKTSKKIEADVASIMEFVHNEGNIEQDYHYYEFDTIQNIIDDYITEIDMHRERKQLNIKGLAHDIKTPLTVINDFLQETNDHSEMRDTSILSLQKISKWIDTIIEDDYKGSFYNINLHNLIQESLVYYERIFESKEIGIEYSNTQDVTVFWNQRDFKVILENMLSNAYYYSTPGTTFKVSLKDTKSSIQMQFTSTGNVSNLSNINSLFKKGYRDSSTSSLNTSGKGVGLYITSLLLVPVNGTINATTDGDSITFTIELKKD